MRRNKHTMTKCVKIEGGESPWNIIIDASFIPKHELSQSQYDALMERVDQHIGDFGFECARIASEVIK